MFTRIAYALTVPFRTLNGAIAPHGRARGERVPGKRARRRSALWNSPGGHRRGERDRAGGDEALDVGRRDADLAEDLGRVRASATPAAIRRPAPLLGEHTAEVLDLRIVE